jgi:hypothetical protein
MASIVYEKDEKRTHYHCIHCGAGVQALPHTKKRAAEKHRCGQTPSDSKQNTESVVNDLLMELWRSIICKYNPKWLHLSRLKAGTVYSLLKTCNAKKTH